MVEGAFILHPAQRIKKTLPEDLQPTVGISVSLRQEEVTQQVHTLWKSFFVFVLVVVFFSPPKQVSRVSFKGSFFFSCTTMGLIFPFVSPVVLERSTRSNEAVQPPPCRHILISRCPAEAPQLLPSAKTPGLFSSGPQPVLARLSDGERSGKSAGRAATWQRAGGVCRWER